MKILFISPDGDGISVVDILAREGHTIYLYIPHQDGNIDTLFDGVCEKVSKDMLGNLSVDLTIADMVGIGDLKLPNAPTLSVSQLGDRLELNRGYFIDICTSLNILTPPSICHIASNELSIAVESFPDGVVIKPSHNEHPSKTVILNSGEEAKVYAELCKGLADAYLVQQRVDGIEISTEGWFNGNDWVLPFNHTIEDKYPFSIGGQLTGCMGCVVFADYNRNSPLVKELLLPLTDLLREHHYVGPIDINAIVTDSKVYALEASARMGYDAIEALSLILQEDLGQFLFRIATGDNETASVSSDFSASNRVTMSPWPYHDTASFMRGSPVSITRPDAIPFVFWSDIFIDNGKFVRYNAYDGVLAKALGYSSTVNGAISMANMSARSVRAPFKQVRLDICARADNDLGTLSNMGWLG